MSYSDNERMPDLHYYHIPKYPVFLECIKVFLMFSIPILMFLYIVYDLCGLKYMYFPAFMLLMPLVSTFVRRKVHLLIPFILLHVLFGVYVYFLAPNELMIVLGMIYVFMIFMYGMVRHMSKELERDMGFAILYMAIAAMTAIFVAAAYRGHEEYETWLLVQGFAYLILFLYYQHRASIEDTLKAMNKDDNFSTTRTVRFNNGMFFAYMGIVGVVFLILYFLGFGTLMSQAGAFLIDLIKRIGRYFAGVEQPPEPVQPQETVPQDPESTPHFGLPAGQTSPFWDAAQKVLVVVFVAFLIVAAIVIIVAIFKRFHHSYKFSDPRFTETKTFYSGAERIKKKRNRLSIFDRSPENRIRREYYNKVKRRMDKTVYRYDTPKEVASKQPEVLPIVEQYEQVRYK